MTKHTSYDELLNSAQFYPIFGPDGQIVGIEQLTVATDRRLGMSAMQELAEEYQQGDEIITATGWTQKQLRIIRSPAPAAAHYLKPSKKWDAASGEMVDSMTILLPYEVVWRLFEILFEGQYSIDVRNVTTESEDILPIHSQDIQAGGKKDGKGDQGGKPDNAPGRIFYSRAEVAITLHLANGQQKVFTGVGVAYDHVRIQKTGNVFAVNSAHRTTEKGAVSDAKREALSNIGRVFRRAFEDGHEMVQTFENLLMEKLRENNKPTAPARAVNAEKVAAPAAKSAGKKTEGKASAGEQKPAAKPELEDEIPFGQFEAEAGPEELKAEIFSLYAEGKIVEQTDDADAYFGFVADLLVAAETVEAVRNIFEENKGSLEQAEHHSSDGNSVSELKTMAYECLGIEPSEETKAELAPKEETTEEAEPANDVSWVLSPSRNTGKEILSAYEAAFEKARSASDVDRILDANTEFAKRLTKSQTAKLIGMAMARRKQFQ